MTASAVAAAFDTSSSSFAAPSLAGSRSSFASGATAFALFVPVLSAFIDNIPFVATMIPVIKNMAPALGGPEQTPGGLEHRLDAGVARRLRRIGCAQQLGALPQLGGDGHDLTNQLFPNFQIDQRGLEVLGDGVKVGLTQAG